ncbi:DEAD/DEAH box helicase [Virgibacillus sp. MG-45]|uniref:DEAD/DEAH box helicase n=1 Tax=Virgibacillus sp. MG-45 TaxID=3102791 RepID=UPI002ED9B0A6
MTQLQDDKELPHLSSDQLSPDQLSAYYSGKRLLRNEIHIQEAYFQWLLSKQYFIPVPAIKRKFFHYTCQRCGNSRRSLFGDIPCASCGETHVYCRKCIMMGRVLACDFLYYWNGPVIERTLLQYEPCTWEGTLTSTQEKAANRIVKAIQLQEKELLIWAVCGSGKTEMLFAGISEGLKKGLRVCIATPRTDVVQELKPRIQQAFSSIPIEALYGGSNGTEAKAQLIISTTHQLLRFQEAFDIMIIDEIDAFPFHSDPSLLFAVQRSRKLKSTSIYLTATPRKQQQMQILLKQLPHFFVPVRYHGHPLPVPYMKMSISLKKDVQNNHPPVSFVSWLKKRKNPNRQLLIFVPTISLVESLLASVTKLLLQEQMIKNKFEIASVYANDGARVEKVQAFRDKKLVAIMTTTILERGVTFPSVDVAIFDAGHDVFDEAALVQIAGRAGRSAEDPKGEVVFFHDGKTEAMIKAVEMIKEMNKRIADY